MSKLMPGSLELLEFEVVRNIANIKLLNPYSAVPYKSTMTLA